MMKRYRRFKKCIKDVNHRYTVIKNKEDYDKMKANLQRNTTYIFDSNEEGYVNFDLSDIEGRE